MSEVGFTASTEVFILNQLKVWGSFGLTVVILMGIIYYLIRALKDEREERKFWQEQTFAYQREQADRLHDSLNTVASAVEVFEAIQRSHS